MNYIYLESTKKRQKRLDNIFENYNNLVKFNFEKLYEIGEKPINFEKEM